MSKAKEIVKTILGFLPKGDVGVAERCNSGAKYRVGLIVVNGKTVCSIPASLNGGKLP